MLKKRYIKAYCMIIAFMFIFIVILNIFEKIQIKKIKTTLRKRSSPTYIFYFIGDGMGANQRQIAEYYKQRIQKDDTAKLLMNTFPVTGLVTTQSADSLVTDSAASSTALATGKKTKNRFISVGPDGKTPYMTLLEAAQKKGMATGLLSNVSIVDATPAAFAAHVKSRYMMDKIAVQYLYKNIDFIAGGGLESFIAQTVEGSTRKDDRNLLQEFQDKGYTIINSRQGLQNIDMSAVDKVLALFSLSNMPFEIDKKNNEKINTPSLAEMLEVGIDLLFKNKEGFFMVVEEGEIDYSGHTSDTVSVIYQMFELDEAVKVAYDFYEKHPEETLIIVVADHETGGLILGLEESYSINLETIDDVKASVFGDIFPKYQENPENIKGLLAYIEVEYNIKLTREEKSQLEKELRKMSFLGYKNSYDEVGGFGYIIGQIISKRTNVGWASTAHTASVVPITVIGMNSQLFGGYMDNTDVAKSIAKAGGLVLE